MVVVLVLLAILAVLGGRSSPEAETTRIVAKIPIGAGSCVAIGVGSRVLVSTNRAAVVRIDPRRNRVVGRAISVGNFPCGLAVGAGSLWVDTYGENLVERVNLRSGKVVKRIRVGFRPWDVIFAAGSVWVYGGLRFLQVLSIAPVFPLVVARVAQHAGGAAIGVINSARIGAGFLGPVVATTLLTWTSPAAVYALLAAVTVVLRVVFRILFGGQEVGHVLLALPEVPLPGWAAGVRLLGPVTSEAVLAGLYDGLRLAAIILCVGAANSLANPTRLLKSLPGALYEIGVAVVVALTYAPNLIADVQRLRAARRLRRRPELHHCARLRLSDPQRARRQRPCRARDQLLVH